jgi:tripartite-type tricarboxylate transporter receptor subunit TctC
MMRANIRPSLWAIGLLAAASIIGLDHAQAQSDYPTRPVRLVVGYAAGGLTDVMTRMLGERMSRELGQPIIVENKPGAGTALASTAVAQAAPDGYTLLMGTTSLAINPTLQPTLSPKNPIAELQPIGIAYETPFVLLVGKSVPARTLAEFIAYAKSRPGQLNVGSSGNGAVNHLILEMFNRQAGVQLTHVPYKGAAPAILDIHAGRLDATFATPLDAIPATAEGNARILAVTSSEPISLLPDSPPIARTLPGFRGVFWQGLFVPVGTPEAITNRLEAALRAATEDAALRTKISERGVTMLTGDASALRSLLKAETDVWGDLIRAANLKVE